ncbi:hypothetical protein [Aeromonas rivipollensis]|uniref:hypothetical protein n=1 Tax=Aeromonas rivipollensis TaxID=948519 RepID=UPI0030D25153
MFFSSKENELTIKNTIKYCERNISNSNIPDFERKLINAIYIMLSAFIKEPAFWDEHCSVGISDIGDSFLTRLNKIDNGISDGGGKVEALYISSLRLFYEGYLASGIELSSDYNYVIKLTKDENNNFSENAREYIDFIMSNLSTHLFRKLMSSPGVKALKEISGTVSSAKSLTQEWNDKLSENIEKANNLKKSIEGYTDAFNFVGLHQGFDQLHKRKVEEKNRLIGLMFFLAILTISPFAAKMCDIYFSSTPVTSSLEGNEKHQPTIEEKQKTSANKEVNLLKKEDKKDSMINEDSNETSSKNDEGNISTKLFNLLPIISFAAILLYFFRVLLFNYKSVCAQVLQIELRMTLCRFIQHYAEHAAEIKKNSDITLDRFETVIFSGLVSNDSDLPATFDGVEQLASLFKTMKGN